MSQAETKIFEKYLIDRLIDCLKIEAEFFRLGQAGQEADVIIRFKDGIDQGIEVVTAYRDDEQAKLFWQTINGEGQALEEYISFLRNLRISYKDEMLKALQAQIDRKCIKSLEGKYGHSPWLCVFENYPFTKENDIKDFIEVLNIPSSKFTKIILLNETHAFSEFKAYQINIE